MGLTYLEVPGRRPGRVWRASGVLAVSVALVVAMFAAPAVADRPSASTFEGSFLWCETEDGFLGLSLFDEGDHGSFMDIFFEPFEGGFLLYGATDDFSFDGSILGAEVPMYLEVFDDGEGDEEPIEPLHDDGDGEEPEPVGVAHVTASLVTGGELIAHEERFRDGNRWVQVEEAQASLTAIGTALLDGWFDVDLADCAGESFRSTAWSTNPRSYVNRGSGMFLACDLEGVDGAGHVYADASEWGTFVEVTLFVDESSALFGWTEDATFTTSELVAAVDLYEEHFGESEDEEPEGPVATADVVASLTGEGAETAETFTQDGRIRTTIETLSVAGSVLVEGASYAMVGCEAASYTEQVVFTEPEGPKPVGPEPSNDVPGGALALAGHGTNAQTGAASEEPEAACRVEFDDHGEDEHDDGGYEVPLGRTVWYSFVGTGGPVTLDTAGTRFDTVIGVYDADLDAVACVDDVEVGSSFSLQAAVTIDTVEGQTYLVQVGGYGGQYGLLKLGIG